MEENKEQRRSVGGLEYKERNTHNKRGVCLKRETKTLCDTYGKYIRTCTSIYRQGVLTAESLLQASELHGCAVGRKSHIVQVS